MSVLIRSFEPSDRPELHRLFTAVFAAEAHPAEWSWKYDQSARLEPRSAGWFAASERRYFTSHFGVWGERALNELATTPDLVARRLDPLPEGRLVWKASGASAIAISPSPSFLPFAYQELPLHAREWSLPSEIASGIAGSIWYARAFDVETGFFRAEGSIPVGEYHPAR